MSYWRNSGLVALGLALLSCTTIVERHFIEVVKPPLEVQIKTDAVYKIDTDSHTASAVGVKLIKISDTQYELTVLSAKHVYRTELTEEYRLQVLKHEDGVESTWVKSTYPISSMDVNPVMDIMLFRVYVDEPLPVLNINISPLKEAQEVFCVGYPLAIGKFITKGYISCFDPVDNEHWLTANVMPGTSGGAIIDSKTGDLIGICCSIMKYTEPPNVGPANITYMAGAVMLVTAKQWLIERGLVI